MKKFMLFFTCSLFATTAARALTASEQLNAVKDIFNQEFKKIDTDNNGVISADEYMVYQFDMLQKSFASATEKKNKTPKEKVVVEDDFEIEEPVNEPEDVTPPTTEKETKKPDLNTISDTTATLQEMANYEVVFDDHTTNEPNFDDEEWYLKPEKLTKEDVMPEVIPEDPDEIVVPDIDLSISEEDSLKNILSELTKKEEVKTSEESKEPTEEEKQKEEKQLKFMLDTIKKTLPKKVDNITTWTDIVYADNTIDYIYQADVDMKKFSPADQKSLKENIENVACSQAYTEMCPRIKSMFIDKGINMKIRYYDKAKTEISFCEFNNKTCK